MRRTLAIKEESYVMGEKVKMEKIAIYTSCLMAVLIGAVAFMWGYGSVVPLKGIGNLKVIRTSISEQKPTMKVSGEIIDSSPGITITSVSQRQKGNCIIIIVRKGFRFGRLSTGRFSIDITVPDNVDAVAVETSKDVIWHR